MNHHISKWLQDIPPVANEASKSSSAPPPPPTKRERDYRPLSPVPSHSTVMSKRGDENTVSDTPKKRKVTAAPLDQAGDAIDTTPRAPNRFLVSDVASLPSASLTSSSRSGHSSPTKQLARLAIDPAGLEIVPLTILDPRLPRPARDMVDRMEQVASGVGVVDGSLKEPIETMKETSLAYNSFRPHVFADEGGLDRIQAKAERLLEDILEVVEKARQCQYVEQDENGWNHHVHTPLLDAVFRYAETNVGYTACMAANISQRYKINGIVSSRVDYGMYVDPRQTRNTSHTEATSSEDLEKKVSVAISTLQISSPEASVNHTDFSPLRRVPLCVSIETKRYGGEERKAEYQLGIWLAAQWRLLAEQAGPRETAEPAAATAEQRAGRDNEGGGPLDLPFLPGILVQGHDWKLVMSTYEGEKTLLWSSVAFGSTRTALDTFKVVAGLGMLFEWADEYAGWYRTHVLRV